MDAPLHFIKNGKSLDKLPPDATIGPARVVEIKDREMVRPDELRKHNLRRGERILLKTRNSSRCWKTDAFVKDFVYISREAAQYVVDRGIRTLGVDYLSVGGFYRDGLETHRILLGAEVWIIEGINLSKVKPGKYELVCLPLKVLGSDGAPARALLR
jgi:arylformamidase